MVKFTGRTSYCALFALLGACNDGADFPADSMRDASIYAKDASIGTPPLARNDASLGGSLGDATSGSSPADASALTDAGPYDAMLAVATCSVSAPTSCPEPAPRYDDVAPIFKEHCQTCHSPDWSGPWPLDSHRHIADWQDDIRGHLLRCTMPPPESGLVIPADKSMTILNWLRCGLPK